MKAEYINPFIAAIVDVFAKMLGCSLKRGDPYLKDRAQPTYEISGIIGLSGKAIGTVVLSLEREVALQATSTLLNVRYKTIDADVIDSIGELTNMIAGSAKAQLEQFEMNMSLPNVISGKNHVIQFPSDATSICIPFDSPWGAVCLEVSLVEKHAAKGFPAKTGTPAASPLSNPQEVLA
ncbi:MAG: chemotaxis protein CheX [Pirellulales bacterium]|nr:chemotaxis protein CheX [Pirellulales bacterium]